MDFNTEDYEEEKNFILNNPATPTLKLMRDFAKQYHKKQLLLHNVSFELPSDEIFDMPEVNLNNPLEEFYYYERPAYLKDDQKQFKERLQKALNYLKGN